MLTGQTYKILNLSPSHKFLYENNDDRNIKRISQFYKRKKALSPDINLIKTEENNIIKNKGKIKKNRNSVEIINIFNFIINKYDEEFNINQNKTKNKDIKENSKTNELKSLYIDLDKDIDVIKNGSNKKIIYDASKLDEENNEIILNDFINVQNKDSFNKNEFALKYLSSSIKSFVKLGNNLKTKAKIKNNEFTESYILALGLCDQNCQKNNYQYFGNIDVIKEEKENDEELMEKGLKKTKSLPKYDFNKKINSKYKKVKKKKINLFPDKNIKNNNNINLNKNKNCLFLKAFNSFYKMKNIKQKIIKLNIPNYDKNFAIMNIEKRKINLNKNNIKEIKLKLNPD
jgi:hypothetical protein